MAGDLKRFSGGSLDIGIDTFNPDFSSKLALTPDTKNITSGINQGVGVRYGMSPIPGQSDSEAPSGTRTNGLMRSEGSVGLTTVSLVNRTRAFKIIPIKLLGMDPMNNVNGSQAFNKNYEQILFLLTGDDDYIDAVRQIYVDSTSGIPTYTPELHQGWSRSLPVNTAGTGSLGVPDGILAVDLSEPTAFGASNTNDFFQYDSSKYFISSASYVHPSKRIPCRWMFGQAFTGSDGDATHAPDAIFNAITFVESFVGGPVSCMYQGNMDTVSRGVEVYTLLGSATFTMNIQYSYSVNLASISNLYCKITPAADIKFATGGAAAVKVTAGTTYTSNDYVLMNDNLMFNDAGYSAIFMVGDNPIMAVTQEWIKAAGPALRQMQYVDLTKDLQRPKTISQAKQTQISSADRYSEDGDVINSSFLKFPKFVRGTVLAPITGDGVKLGDPETGILIKDRVYEITYSYYNKRMDFETNVGAPVKIQIGDTDDNVCLILGDANGVDTNYKYFVAWYAGGTGSPAIWFNFYNEGLLNNEGNGAVPYLNTTEIRFYYREEGTFEWLPAGNFDAAEFWFRPNPNSWCRICQGPTAGLPGGQPGGFNDYSPLPKDTYSCVVVYQNRTFWIAPKSLNFSLRDNPFAYSLRNTATAQTGEFLGAIVHNYPGEAQQTSRLIVFATNAVYVGRFTGEIATTAVQVSPDSVGEYPLDGSDFTLDLWTTVTSFSHRSACVAEGYLYYWGPQGIFRDNGTQNPDRISIPVEPYLFSVYDKAQVNDIFCYYNNQTQEILWFYSPASAPTITHALVYNLNDKAFLRQEFTCKIDDASQVPLTGENSESFGQERTIISTRSDNTGTVQRMFFFDYLNRAGDMRSGNEVIIDSFSTPSTGVRRFNLALGSMNPDSSWVGSEVCLTQLDKYAPDIDGDNFIGKVVAVNAVSDYVDVAIPDGITFPASDTLTYDEFFPLYIAEEHAIDWTISTKYWLPTGINEFWVFLWLYFLFKYQPLPNVNTTHRQLSLNETLGASRFNISYRTPSGAPVIADEIQMIDNSDGNFQLYHALREGNQNNQGQALKTILSGVHIGEEWVLQYIEMQNTLRDIDGLKEYQG